MAMRLSIGSVHRCAPNALGHPMSLFAGHAISRYAVSISVFAMCSCVEPSGSEGCPEYNLHSRWWPWLRWSFSCGRKGTCSPLWSFGAQRNSIYRLIHHFFGLYPYALWNPHCPLQYRVMHSDKLSHVHHYCCLENQLWFSWACEFPSD